MDLPAVRESLKTSVNAMVAKDIEQKGNEKFAKLGAAFAAAFTGPLVEAYVTPQNIAKMIQGRRIGQVQDGHDRFGGTCPTT